MQFHKLFLFIFIILLPGISHAQRPMKIIVKIKNIRAFPLILSADSSFNYSWENLAISTQTGNGTGVRVTAPTFSYYEDSLTLPDTGTYRIQFFSATPNHHLSWVGYNYSNNWQPAYTEDILEQWGDIKWTMFSGLFGMTAHINTDTPDFSRVTSLHRALENCQLDSIPNIEYWDVSNVVTTYETFKDYTKFNQDISRWNLSRDTNMRYMFQNATSFNQPLNDWDVSNVKFIDGMFMGATSFNQPLNKWKFSKSLYEFQHMFYNATSFNADINGWDVSSVVLFENMFNGATSFNQPLDKWEFSINSNQGSRYSGHYRKFDAMFENATSFNQSLNEWGKTFKENGIDQIYTTRMFKNAVAYNQPMDEWGKKPGDTAEVHFVYSSEKMFEGAESFNQRIDNWLIRNQNLTSMFKNAASFNQPMDNLEVRDVVKMDSIFDNAISFNQNLGNWTLRFVNNIGLAGSGIDCANYSKSIVAWSKNPESSRATVVDARNLVYSPKVDTLDVSAARDFLTDANISGRVWQFLGDTITGDSCKPASTSGINIPISLRSVQIYPNPVSHTLYLSNLPIGVDVTVFDVMGRKIFSSSVQQSNFKINTESWAQGVYLVQLNYRGERWMEKVVK